MTKLNAAQIALAAAAAFPDKKARIKAVAVALAESGGDTQAVGVNSDKWRSRDRGLWQINDHWHPEVSDATAFDPRGCAAAAAKISKNGTDWSPWSTWKNGSAQVQMSKATMGVEQSGSGVGNFLSGAGDAAGDAGLGVLANLPGGGLFVGEDGLQNPLAPLQQIGQIVIRSAAWLQDPHNWLRIVFVAGGSLAGLLALYMIANSGAAGSGAKSAARLPAKAVKGAVPALRAVG